MKKPYFLPTALIPPHRSFGEAGRGLFFIILLLLPLFTTAQVIVTCAGGGSASLGDGGPAIDAEVLQPFGMALDDSGNLYICSAYRIRKVSPGYGGIITTIAGNGTPGYSGDHGLGIYAQIAWCSDVFVDHHGSVYIADAANNCIRKVTNADTITTIAGTGVAGYNGDNILATTAQLNIPEGIAVDSIGNVYIVDKENFRIRKVDTAGIITTIAGIGVSGFSPDGSRADTAKLDSIESIRIDKIGNIFFADNVRIRKIDTAGIITTIAGTGIIGYSGDSGVAINAEIGGGAIAIDSAGNLYIADEGANRIRKVDTAGIITTIAGNGISGYYGDNGNPLSAELRIPQGVAVSNNGDVYIGDTYNDRVRLITMHPVGINAIASSSGGISVYPNPANEEVTITAKTNNTYTLVITDVLGRSVYKDNFTGRVQLPLNNWQSGFYYVQVMSENGYKEVKKLIVQ